MVPFRRYFNMATFSSFFCGTFSVVIMQYGGTFLAVPGISYYGGTDFGGSCQCQNMAVITASTGTAHHARWENYGGNFLEEYPGIFLPIRHILLNFETNG